MKAIAIQDIWNHYNNTTISTGQEFDFPADQVQSLINIGAAKLPDESKPEEPQAQQVQPQATPTTVE